MLETQELIDVTLSHAGETLEFEAGEILGIPGHLVYNIPSFDSPFDIEKQDYTFQVSLNDFHELAIEKDDVFTYILLDKNYEFSVTTYIDDLTGWMQLSCSLQGVVA